MEKKRTKTKLSKKLYELLVCPRTGGNLTLSKNQKELISLTAKLAYPVRDGIPIMIESEARELSEAELKSK